METLKEIVGKYLDPEDPRYHKLLDELESREIEWQYREDNNCGVVDTTGFGPEVIVLFRKLMGRFPEVNGKLFHSFFTAHLSTLQEKHKKHLHKAEVQWEYISTTQLEVRVTWVARYGDKPFHKYNHIIV